MAATSEAVLTLTWHPATVSAPSLLCNANAPLAHSRRLLQPHTTTVFDHPVRLSPTLFDTAPQVFVDAFHVWHQEQPPASLPFQIPALPTLATDLLVFDWLALWATHAFAPLVTFGDGVTHRADYVVANATGFSTADFAYFAFARALFYMFATFLPAKLEALMSVLRETKNMEAWLLSTDLDAMTPTEVVVPLNVRQTTLNFFSTSPSVKRLLSNVWFPCLFVGDDDDDVHYAHVVSVLTTYALNLIEELFMLPTLAQCCLTLRRWFVAFGVVAPPSLVLLSKKRKRSSSSDTTDDDYYIPKRPKLLVESALLSS